MRVSHSFPAISAVFDDPNLVSCAGLAPTMALAHRAGLADLVSSTLTLKAEGSANAHLKVPALVAGMVAGADSIDDMDLLRHGGMGRLFTGIRAPSTLGTFLRTFTFGHVRQLDAVASRFLTALASNAPILGGVDQVCYVDIDDTIKATHGYQKQGAGYGYTGVKGLNALLAIVSTPTSAPVIAATRLRRGGTNSARGAARLVTDALNTAKACGAAGLVTVRADSAYYGHDVIAAARRGGARFSVTARMNHTVVKAISQIEESAWVPIHYPNAIWDSGEQRFISDAQVAEVPFTAFTSRRQSEHISARLIVRRVKRLNPKSVPHGQGELFAAYRHHGVFTDSPLTMLQAETDHRDHAIVEQAIADLKAGPLAHLPSGSFAANSAWLVLAAIAFNLTRAAGTLASVFHTKATTATIRRQLINVPARLASSARRLVMHLPKNWPWQDGWDGLFNAACGPPPPATT
ncbi:MAG: IS1380 family transposase [Phycicoccus sp.]|nr:IS1380 family transposase [Phycicoccus sp.]NMM34663.1 IS1380 family transposase [Phycicoccus sp.]